MSIKINAFCLVPTPSDAEDESVEGVYAITFNVDIAGLSPEKLASMALDIFHDNVAVGTLDEFEFSVLDDNDELMEEDPTHESYSASKTGVVDKIDDVPFTLYGDDIALSPEALDNKYNPDGNGEHPVHTRNDWREAVSQENTISGYWVWVKHQLNTNAEDA